MIRTSSPRRYGLHEKEGGRGAQRFTFVERQRGLVRPPLPRTGIGAGVGRVEARTHAFDGLQAYDINERKLTDRTSFGFRCKEVISMSVNVPMKRKYTVGALSHAEYRLQQTS